MFRKIKNTLILLALLVCVNNALKTVRRENLIKILNVVDNQKFFHRVILLKGLIDYSFDWSVSPKLIPTGVLDKSYENKGLNHREITIENLSTKSTWPVSNFHEFKGLVKLANGSNKIKITYSYTHKMRHNNQDYSIDETSETYINLIYEENTNLDPLHLAILLARDSKERFDINPALNEKNDLESGIKRYQTAALLWQAFTCDDMFQKGLGCRTFRFEETDGDLPMVNVIRSSYALSEIQVPNGDAVYDLFSKAIKADNFYKIKKQANKPLNVGGLIFDSHWDVNTQKVLGHTALGGGNGDIGLGVFGSYLTYAWPENLSDVKRRFTDNTRVDYTNVFVEKFLADKDKRYLFAFDIGAGALLHEVGHIFGLYNTNAGMMARGFDQFHRAFLSIEVNADNTWSAVRHNPVFEPFVAHTWDIMDAIKLSLDPTFRLPNEPQYDNKAEPSVLLLPTSTNEFVIYSKTGISLIEFHDGNTWTYQHYRNPESQVVINLNKFPAVLEKRNNVKISLLVTTKTNKKTNFNDLFDLIDTSLVLDSTGNAQIKTQLSGWMTPEEDKAPVKFDINFNDKTNGKLNKFIVIYNKWFVYGFRFIYANGKQIDIGDVGRESQGVIDFTDGKTKIISARVTSGAWIDSLSFVLSNANGVESTSVFGGNGPAINEIDLTLMPDLQISGVYGVATNLINQLGFYYRKA